MQAIKTVR